MKITVHKKNFTVGPKQFFIAPLMFFHSHDRLINHSSTDNSSNIIENKNKEKEVLNPSDPEQINYPISSDDYE